jgi:hypothetical protein
LVALEELLKSVSAYFFPGIMRITGADPKVPQATPDPGMRYPNLGVDVEQNSRVAQKS